MFCKNCGKEIDDKAVICPNCGCATENEVTTNKSNSETLKLITKIFMVIGCVVSGIYLIPLCWTIPMTIHYFKSVKENRKVGIAFKICSLLFVNLIAGILMLCEDINN